MSNKIRLSMVEDDDILRASFESAFADDAEMEMVGSYADAEDFLLHLDATMPDVVIMDIRLPGMNGIEALRKVKALRPAIQFLICTVQDDDQNLFDALCAGATGYLLKDASPDKVIEAVKQLYAGGSPMSAGIARRVIASFRQQRSPGPEVHRLTDREKEVLDQLAQGFRYKEIAGNLSLSLDTVRTHVRNLYEKLQVSSRTDALNKLFPR